MSCLSYLSTHFARFFPFESIEDCSRVSCILHACLGIVVISQIKLLCLFCFSAHFGRFLPFESIVQEGTLEDCRRVSCILHACLRIVVISQIKLSCLSCLFAHCRCRCILPPRHTCHLCWDEPPDIPTVALVEPSLLWFSAFLAELTSLRIASNCDLGLMFY